MKKEGKYDKVWDRLEGGEVGKDELRKRVAKVRDRTLPEGICRSAPFPREF